MTTWIRNRRVLVSFVGPTWSLSASVVPQLLLFFLLLVVAGTARAQGDASQETNVRFVLTTERYEAEEDLAAAVMAEFGANAKVADWSEIKERFGRSQASIAAFARGIGLDIDEHAWVVLDGNRVFPGSGVRGEPGRVRYYLISRWDRTIPQTYEVHDQIADGVVVLGSWYDLALPILVKLQ